LLFIIAYNIFPMLALGMLFHVIGIIAGVVSSSYIVSKWN
jgi:hypothetical protein